MLTGVTVLILAVLMIGFGYIVWHTFHGDIVPLLVGAVIFLVILGLGFIGIDLLGWI